MSHLFFPADLLNFDSGTDLYNGYSLFFYHYDIPIFWGWSLDCKQQQQKLRPLWSLASRFVLKSTKARSWQTLCYLETTHSFLGCDISFFNLLIWRLNVGNEKKCTYFIEDCSHYWCRNISKWIVRILGGSCDV